MAPFLPFEYKIGSASIVLVPFVFRRYAASFKYQNDQGLEDICLALVVSEHFDWDGLAQHLRGALAPDSRPSSYLRVNAIPRNTAGKVMRNHLTHAKISGRSERKNFV